MRKRSLILDSLTTWLKVVAVLLVYVLCVSNGDNRFSKLTNFSSRIKITNAGYALVTAIGRDDLRSIEGNVELAFAADDTFERETEVEPAITSIDSMLQWAIGHADPEKLRGLAQEVQRLTPHEVEKRRAVIRELMGKLKMSSDADLMKVAIADLHNVSLSAEARKRALEELLILVEPIDNANDLNKLGGLVTVIKELDREEVELRAAAAAVLAVASENNPVVQAQLLRYGVLPKLMKMVRSSAPKKPQKRFTPYLRSSEISHPVMKYFIAMEGFCYLCSCTGRMQELMSNENVDTRLQKNALSLVADLAEQRIEIRGQLDAYKLDDGFLRAVVGQAKSVDLDTLRRIGQALDALKSLHKVSRSLRETLQKVGRVEVVLEQLELYFQKLTSEPDQERAEYIRELEELRRELTGLFASEEKENVARARLQDEEILYL
ncbi:hypothetical protein R1flu_015801 [Riccia fluitans]|uniref:Nucleotide exchange factor Fes1 domain-containing protein n=1 Tax=Riccia fluitans TaxID=41844 RepID=A0ABD1YKA1_9MARC